MTRVKAPQAPKLASGPRASVLVTTYNWPAAFEKVLWSFFAQNRRNFELVIADDGSRPETAELIARMAEVSPVPIRYVWQPDAGFGKCRILNKALALSQAERIVVTDGDCVVMDDFVDTHIRRARPGRFLSGSYFKQSQAVSDAITPQGIADQSVFTPRWLAAQGVSWGRLVKVMGDGWRWRLLDRIGGGRLTRAALGVDQWLDAEGAARLATEERLTDYPAVSGAFRSGPALIAPVWRNADRTA